MRTLILLGALAVSACGHPGMLCVKSQRDLPLVCGQRDLMEQAVYIDGRRVWEGGREHAWAVHRGRGR